MNINTKQIVYGVVVIIVLLAIVWVLSMTGDRMNDSNNATSTDEIIGEALMGSGTYTADPAQTRVGWEGSKTLIANYKDNGTVALRSGTVVVTDGSVASGEFVFDMTTITAESTGRGEGEDNLSKHLKSADFFDVATYPTSTFTLTSVEASDDEGWYDVTGDFTLKGVTNPVSFPARIYMEGGNVHVVAEFDLDRTEWGVQYGSGKFFDDLGDNVIDDIFTIDLHLVALPGGSQAATSTQPR